MLRLPDRPINKHQLGEELAALNLPGFTGFARLSRDVDDQGRAILENGKPKKIAPYILVKSDPLTGPQTAAAMKAVLDHVPVVEPPPPPRFEIEAQAIETAGTLGEIKVVMAALVRAL